MVKPVSSIASTAVIGAGVIGAAAGVIVADRVTKAIGTEAVKIIAGAGIDVYEDEPPKDIDFISLIERVL